jgi:exodeoxyribonuclease-5
VELTQSQSEAIDRIIEGVRGDKKVLALSGAAGTGKTTIINNLVMHLSDVVVCTPTNKAAQVLVSKGIDAATFYKRFYILEEGDRRRGSKPKFVSCKKVLDGIAAKRGGNPLDLKHQLPKGKRAFVETIIVDEASMVSSRMVSEMRAMCDNLILVGDKHQLPPVGDRETPAGYFASLKPDAELTEVLRQAEGSLILQLANDIRLGSNKVGAMLRHFEPQESFQEWASRGTRTIAFTNKERQRINHITRGLLGFDQPVPMVGDRVIVTNNYNDDFINGTEATVLDFEWDGVNALAIVRLDNGLGARLTCSMWMRSFIEDQVGSQRALLEANFKPIDSDVEAIEIAFGNCITAHKAQGSEFPRVAVIDQLNLIRKVASNEQFATMSPDEYARRWLYTAITRARQNLVFAPTWWAQRGIGND